MFDLKLFQKRSSVFKTFFPAAVADYILWMALSLALGVQQYFIYNIFPQVIWPSFPFYSFEIKVWYKLWWYESFYVFLTWSTSNGGMNYMLLLQFLLRYENYVSSRCGISIRSTGTNQIYGMLWTSLFAYADKIKSHISHHFTFHTCVPSLPKRYSEGHFQHYLKSRSYQGQIIKVKFSV